MGDEQQQQQPEQTVSESPAVEKEPASEEKGLFTKVQESFISKRKDSKRYWQSLRLEVLCFVIIVGWASYFTASHYRGQSTALLYYYEDATVTDVEEVEGRWKVAIKYPVGNDYMYKNLYYRKNPAYVVGDTIVLKIQTLDPSKIEIEGAK